MGSYNIGDFIQSENFLIPSRGFLYDPGRPCSFAPQGEKMVGDLLAVSGEFYLIFNELIPLKMQETIANESFAVMKEEWLARKVKKELEALSDPDVLSKALLKEAMLKAADSPFRDPKVVVKKTQGKKFFETNRKFKNLVPVCYKTSEAPRITTLGSTLHGMKKDLSGKMLKRTLRHLLAEGKNYSILDIDMSAAHSRFAISLSGTRNSDLYRAVDGSAKFWDERASFFHAKVEAAGIPLNQEEVRKMLKVALYTSLNGGNPVGVARLYKNISDHKPTLINGFKSTSEFENSNVYIGLRSIFSQFVLIDEVKEINTKCITEDGGYTFTINREEPYAVDSPHKGISRALQGFEVVLLAVLTRAIVSRGGLPINLAHDGVMAVFPGVINDEELMALLSKDLEPWAHYLLDGLRLPVECKFNWNKTSI